MIKVILIYAAIIAFLTWLPLSCVKGESVCEDLECINLVLGE